MKRIALVGINDETDEDEAIDMLVDAIMAEQSGASKAMPAAKPYQAGAAPGPGLQLIPSKTNPMVRRWQGGPKPEPQERQGKVNVGVAVQKQPQPQQPQQEQPKAEPPRTSVQPGKKEDWNKPDTVIDIEARRVRQFADEIVDERGLNEEFNSLRDRVNAGKQTKELHTEAGEYTSSRRQRHNRIIEGALHQIPSQAEPSVIYMGGVPGSGKSTIVKMRGFNDFVHIDSDDVKRQLPEYQGWNAALLQDEATDVVSEIISQAEEGRKNILIDCTLKTPEQYIAQIDTFRKLGYKVGVVFADLPPEKAITRAIDRYVNPEGDHRFVDPRYIATHDHKNRRSYEKLKQLADFFEAYDNDVPKGHEPVLLEKRDG